MMIFRALVFNTFTLALLAVAAIVASINIYVSFHDDGILMGIVTGPDGAPVPGVEITVYRTALIGLDEVETQVTDLNGGFRFQGHDLHHPILQAKSETLGNSSLHRIRLLFRNQNKILEDPIILEVEE